MYLFQMQVLIGLLASFMITEDLRRVNLSKAHDEKDNYVEMRENPIV